MVAVSDGVYGIGVIIFGLFCGNLVHSFVPIYMGFATGIWLMRALLIYSVEDAIDELKLRWGMRKNRRIQPMNKNEIILCIRRESVVFTGVEDYDGMISFSRDGFGWLFGEEDPLAYKRETLDEAPIASVTENREVYRVDLLYPLKQDTVVAGQKDEYFTYSLLVLFIEDLNPIDVDQLRRMLRLRVRATYVMNSLEKEIDTAFTYFEKKRVYCKENHSWIEKRQLDQCIFYQIDEFGCIADQIIH